ncbi:glycosyltransferase family 2 protein [Paenibacillus soyae]|uniref:Glycosyltransferase n=1 Tax=Paenibacillus soyae TaxID=2969249 RepID=A0A9X2N0B0_9BACL|nr:glycosyltransferase family 2 protein [Paenibacillus soyae]MCR2806712.1 glycosyltransferase [Paenibacillus soyae]
MKKISIIIPVFNVEPYIRRCLDSVVHQTFRNLEIICVNDGSTDLSGVICDEYARIDARVAVIHQANAGVAAALNAGLDKATGVYIGIVDPDDWVEPNFYELMYDAIEYNDVDFVCSGWRKEFDYGGIDVDNKIKLNSPILNRNQALTMTFIRDMYPAFGAYYWNKLFRADRFMGSSGLRFREDIRVGNDVLLFTEYLLHSKQAYYMELPLYHYYQREQSLFHSKDIEQRRGSLIAYAQIIELLKENGIPTDIIIWVKRFYVYHASLLAEIAIETNDGKNLENMQQEIKRYLNDYMDTNRDYPERIARLNRLLMSEL